MSHVKILLLAYLLTYLEKQNGQHFSPGWDFVVTKRSDIQKLTETLFGGHTQPPRRTDRRSDRDTDRLHCRLRGIHLQDCSRGAKCIYIITVQAAVDSFNYCHLPPTVHSED